MMAESNNPELIERGRNNLIAAFGSMKKAIEHIENEAKKSPAN